MKTKISITVILLTFLTSLITVMGQEKTDKKKQEEDLQKAKERSMIIIDSKKNTEKELQNALNESFTVQEKALKEKLDGGYIDSKTFEKELLDIREHQKKMQELKFNPDIWGPVQNFSYSTPYRFDFGSNRPGNVYEAFSRDRENTSMSISKTLEDVTFATDFTYDVKKESSNVSFFVTGTLKAGELKITLKKPDKTAFQEITISPLADVNWNQQFSWEDDEADQYVGKWIISISAAKANGNYRVQVNSR